MTNYTTSYSNLWLSGLDEKQHDRTCGYWYTITDRQCPFTAFKTKEALQAWAELRGIALPELPPIGDPFSTMLEGEYFETLWNDADGFNALQGVRIYKMDNGDWTTGIVTEKTVNVLNCNLPREKYDYRATGAKFDSGLHIIAQEQI